MQIRTLHRSKEDLSLNLTPLIDIVFLLLLFFMVSTTFKQPRALNVELPDVSVQTPKYGHQEKRIIEIGINQQGYYFIQQKPLNTNNEKVLKKILSSLMSPETSALEIIIMGDKLAPHQSVVSAMDVVAQLGIKQLKIKANTQ